MQYNLNKYELAVEFEKAGYFQSAYLLYCESLKNTRLDYGNTLFKCGWCLENTNRGEYELALSYYLKAGAASKSIACRMNSFFRAGWILMHLKKNEEAIKAYKYAVQIGHSEGNFDSIYQESLYWCAVCLEAENRFLDAIDLYRAVKEISPSLNPECRYREIICLITVGLFDDAARVCESFTLSAPTDFSGNRYRELLKLVEKEKNLLIKCNNKIIFNKD